MTAVSPRLYPYKMHLGPDEARIAALGTFVEMIRSATPRFNDSGAYEVDAVAEAARAVGIRGILSRSGRDIAGERAVLEHWRGDAVRGLFFGGAVSTSQILSGLALAAACALWPSFSRRAQTADPARA